MWKGLVSHLAVVFEEATSDTLDFWSLSLLLYVGRVVGDLMSGVVDWDGEEVVGFEVDDRSSMLPTLPVSVWSHFWKLWGKELRERWCGSGRASVCELGESETAVVRPD